MELRQLEYFAEVAELLNFGQAAERLHVGQPAVSQQIRRLERELDRTLFDRSSRTVRLTEAGRRLLPEARAVLAAVERAREAVQGDPPSRQLRLGTSTGLGERLEQVLEAMQRLSPGVHVELVNASTRARLERVRAGQLDAAFVRGTTSVTGLELIPVWQDQLVAALPARHELARLEPARLEPARLEPVPVELLRDLPLRIARRRDNPPLVDLVLAACADAGFEPVLGPANDRLEDTLAEIGTGPPCWTVVYEAHARIIHSSRLAFRPLRPALYLPTLLAVPASATSRSLAPLLRACAEAAATDHDS
ncbi:MAG TPA: LysR family transcriptional regulator [Jatrophihabitantaceae bacterium]